MPGDLRHFLRRSISEDEERTALSKPARRLIGSKQLAYAKCHHGFETWMDCPRCTDDVDRDDY